MHSRSASYFQNPEVQTLPFLRLYSSIPAFINIFDNMLINMRDSSTYFILEAPLSL